MSLILHPDKFAEFAASVGCDIEAATLDGRISEAAKLRLVADLVAVKRSHDVLMAALAARGGRRRRS